MMDAEDQSPESNDSKEEFKPDENTALLRDAKPAQYELSRLTTPRLSRKKHVSVIWSVSLGIVLLCALEVAVFMRGFNLGLRSLDDKKEPYAFLCLMHLLVWTALLGLYYYGERCHHSSRLLGYLKFYRETQLLRRIPLVCLSVINSVLLAFTTFWGTNDEAPLDRHDLMQVIVSIEMAISLPSFAIYLRKVLHFNTSNQLPDVHMSLAVHHTSWDFTSNAINTDPSITNDMDVAVDELLERQSDAIRYMQGYIANLESEISTLHQKLRQQRPLIENLKNDDRTERKSPLHNNSDIIADI